MAGRGLGTLTLDLVARTGGFTGPLDKAGKDLDKRMKAMTKRAEQFGRVIGVALAGAATAAGYAIKSAIDRADELFNAAQKIGVTTETLSGLSYAAKQAGLELEGLGRGLTVMIKNQAAAAQGNDRIADAYAAFNIQLKDSTGHLRDSQAVLLDWAEVFKTLPDGAEKTALAMRVFGKAGAEMIPFLNEGREGIAALIDEAERLGLVISSETGRQADEFNDTLDRLKGAASGVALLVATDLLPDLQTLASRFTDGATAGDQMSETAKSIAESLRLVVDMAGAAYNGIGYLVDRMVQLNEKWREWQANTPLGMLAGMDAERFKKSAAAAGRSAEENAAQFGQFASGQWRSGQSKPAVEWIDAPERSPAAAAAAAAKLLANEQDKGTSSSKAATEARRAAAAAAREQAERERELAEAVKKATEAQAEFTMQLEDLVAQQGGPLAESQLRYRREEEALRKLWAEGSTPNAEELARAINLLHEARDKDAESIRKSLDTGGQRLEQMRNELAILQMTSQEERDRAAFLLENPTATDAQADEAARLLAQTDQLHQAIAAADDFRSSMEDAFASILDGSKSAKEAFDDMAKSILAQIARMIAQQWVEKLFGMQGTTMGGGGGGGGGFLSGLMGLFGGGGSSGAASGGGGMLGWMLPGYAEGTDFHPGGLAIVGERGPEIVNLPRGSSVTPKGAGGNTFNFNIAGDVSKKTALQLSVDLSRKVAQARRVTA